MRNVAFLLLGTVAVIVVANPSGIADGAERQLTDAPHGHILTNVGVWSPDGAWIYYDVRSDAAGSEFDGERIERVHAVTGEVETVFHAARGARCGVVTASPVDARIVFIHGPEDPTPDWQYAAWHRRGVIVDALGVTPPVTLDARDVVPPFTPGALRGGTHVHVFDGAGEWVCFTYEDHVLATSDDPHAESNHRHVGVSVPHRPVVVPRTHPRNHDGVAFSVLVTRSVDRPRPGSDEISRAYSDAWVGRDGYVRADGTRQRRAIAFLGDTRAVDGQTIPEVFVVDLPDDLTQPGDAPLEGTALTRPAPPRGVAQRRLTFTHARRFPGACAPRHWLRSAPNGSRIAWLMADDQGVAQLWTIAPTGGEPQQLTRGGLPIESAFTWHPDGTKIACVIDGSVCEVDAASGEMRRLTPRDAGSPPRPEACVYSPDGSKIAFVREIAGAAGTFNHVFVVPTAP